MPKSKRLSVSVVCFVQLKICIAHPTFVRPTLFHCQRSVRGGECQVDIVGESGSITFTTVQKFELLSDEDEHPLLCERSNVVAISDEAHRSQYGLKTPLARITDKETGEFTGAKYVFGYAKHMRDALPQGRSSASPARRSTRKAKGHARLLTLI